MRDRRGGYLWKGNDRLQQFKRKWHRKYTRGMVGELENYWLFHTTSGNRGPKCYNEQICFVVQLTVKRVPPHGTPPTVLGVELTRHISYVWISPHYLCLFSFISLPMVYVSNDCESRNCVIRYFYFLMQLMWLVSSVIVTCVWFG